MFDHVPEDWELKSLGDVVGLLTDYTANGSFEALRINVQYYYDENYAALVRVTDLGKTDFIPKVFTDERGYFFQKKTALYGGEIVLANVGSVGKVYKVPKNYPMPMTLAPNTYLVKFDPSTIDEEFGYQFLISDFYVKGLFQNISSTTLAAINKASFRSIKILLPNNKSEQSKIAQILDTLDTAIRETEAIIAKLKAVKQGLLHDLLTRGIDANGELRPSQSEAPHLYKRSPLGWVPKDWEDVTLGEIAARSGGLLQTGPFGSQLHAYEYVAEGIPVIMPQDMLNGELSTEYIARISNRKAAQLSRHRVLPNDIIFSRRGDLSRCVAIESEHSGWLCGTGCLLARLPKEEIDGFWLSFVYPTQRIQTQVLGRAVGSTMANLNTSILAAIRIGRPTIEEQLEVSERLKSIGEKIVHENLALRKMQISKSGLMNDLLTGRVRVTPLLDSADA